MRLDQKLRKLADGRALQSVQRRVNRLVLRPRAATALTPAQIIRNMERRKLEAIVGRYEIEGASEGWSKYLELDQWIEVNLGRVRELSLDRGPRRRILDLGCGAGYFLAICQQLGHEVIGLDLDRVPMFREMTEALGVTRVVSRVQPFVPLPDLGARFDLITAFMICFNDHKSANLWGVEEWDFFLDDLARLLAPAGRVCLELNRESDGTHYTRELKELFEQRGAEIRAGRVLFKSGLRVRAAIAPTAR